MEGILLPEWQVLKDEIMNYEKGKVFEHEELAKIMLVPARSQKYYNLMQQAIKNLTEIGIRLSNVKGIGYKILAPDEWVEEARSKVRKGGKSLQEAQQIINHAPFMEMSEEARLECLKIHDVLIKQKFLLAGGVVSISDNNTKRQIQIREGNKI